MRCSPTLSSWRLVLAVPVVIGATTVRRAVGASGVRARLARGARTAGTVDATGAAGGKHRAHSSPSSPWMHSSFTTQPLVCAGSLRVGFDGSVPTYLSYGHLRPTGDRTGTIRGPTGDNPDPIGHLGVFCLQTATGTPPA